MWQVKSAKEGSHLVSPTIEEGPPGGTPVICRTLILLSVLAPYRKTSGRNKSLDFQSNRQHTFDGTHHSFTYMELFY